MPIIRLEQLYPLGIDEVFGALEGLPDGTDLVWVQEEPTNMGCWPYLKLRFGDKLAERFPLRSVTRAESASPSTGSMATHKLEQAELIDEAFAGL